DLTAAVTDGLWCNSDWSLGSAADPTRCRYNGTGGAAFGTVSAAEGQDYTYPWAPPGFVVSQSAGATTTLTYAAQKVTLNGTLTGTAINAANWNATSQNQKYFYENENIIWCDPTSPSWPQTGAPQTQTCSGPFPQTCTPSGTQTCQPPLCSITYNPPGCNLLPPDPENPCIPVTTCAPPVCTPDPGHCSLQPAKTCAQNSDCASLAGA